MLRLAGQVSMTSQKPADVVTGRHQDQLTTHGRDEEGEERAPPAPSADALRMLTLDHARRPVIAEPSSCGVTVLRVERADQPAAQQHLDRVGQADQLVEVGGDQQHGEPGAASLADVVPDLRLGADVDAAGRVGGDSRTGSPLISRPTMNFCWLPPESADRGGVDAGGADVVLVDDPLGVGARAAAVDASQPLTLGPGSGDRGCGSPRAASRAAGRGAAGPRG